MTGSQQIAMLQRLSQDAIAHLLGVNARSIRYQAGKIPRNPDETYNAQAVVAWMKHREPRPELSDDEYEKVLTAAGLMVDDLAEHNRLVGLCDFLRDLLERFGDAGAGLFLEGMLEVACPIVAQDRPHVERPPDRREYLERAERDYAEAVLRHQVGELAIATVCDSCLRVRNGRRWIKADPPQGYELREGLCQECERAGKTISLPPRVAGLREARRRGSQPCAAAAEPEVARCAADQPDHACRASRGAGRGCTPRR